MGVGLRWALNSNLHKRAFIVIMMMMMILIKSKLDVKFAELSETLMSFSY